MDETPETGDGASVSPGTDSVGSSSQLEDEHVDQASPLPEGTRVADRYAIVSVLGRGGYAVVYRALDEVNGAHVALKVLRADRIGASALKRLTREAEAARCFTSDRLVRVLDQGSSGACAFLVMELVSGQTLRERLRSGPVDIDEAVRVATDILEGLAVLHHAGIVHRDVKPSNILLDADGRARLGDFGLVTRWADDQSRATRSEAIVGTLAYVSPEQALGEELDGRSDLYALGVVLFEMLTGAPLHGTRSSLGTLVAHLTKPAPDLRTTHENVPEWLARAVTKLLAKTRRERYASASEVLADLRAKPGPRLAKSVGSRSRFQIAALIGLLAVVGAAPWRFLLTLATGSAAPALVSADVKGGLLRGLDANGKLLWTRHVGVPIPDEVFTPLAVTHNHRLAVADLDGEGTMEVLLTHETEPGGQRFLTVWNADGSARFRHTPGRKVRYDTADYENFNAEMVLAFTDRRGTRRLFLVSGHVTWFPSVLEELGPAGEVIGDYFTSGRVQGIRRIEFRGREALALLGYHNETRGAAITILSVENPTGRAPAMDPTYLCSTCPQRDPLALAVLPRSDAVLAGEGPEGSALGTHLVPLEAGNWTTGAEHGTYTDVTGARTAAVVNYSLGPSLDQLLDVRPSEKFKILHDRYFAAGSLDHAFGPRDIAALERVTRWNGNGWATVPFQRARQP